MTDRIHLPGVRKHGAFSRALRAADEKRELEKKLVQFPSSKKVEAEADSAA